MGLVETWRRRVWYLQRGVSRVGGDKNWNTGNRIGGDEVEEGVSITEGGDKTGEEEREPKGADLHWAEEGGR